MNREFHWLAPVALVISAPQCLAAQYMSVDRARELIFPLADEYVAKPIQLTPEKMREIDKASGVTGRSTRQQAWQAFSKGRLVGWFFVDQVIGKHELITYALGINAEGAVHQFEIIEYLEAYGSQVRYPNWREQFVGKTVKDTLQIDSDIGNISGATLSARHLTDGIKRLLFVHQTALR